MVYASVTGRQKALLVDLDKKQTWVQPEPKGKFVSVPVMNLSILPRSTLPLLPPVWTLKQVHIMVFTNLEASKWKSLKLWKLKLSQPTVEKLILLSPISKNEVAN